MGEQMSSLNIERLQYVALRTGDPEAAANFAAERMGLSLEQDDGEGGYYLKAHGPDPYSLVYLPGEPGLDHLGYLVRDRVALEDAAKGIRAMGVECELLDAAGWGQDAALQMQTPGGHSIRLTTGHHSDLPVAAVADIAGGGAQPIACDHVVLRVTDFAAEERFVEDVLGMRNSAKLVTPDQHPVLAFYRAGILFHNVGLAQSGSIGVHHYQFTLKNPESFYSTRDALVAAGVEILWGPLRHGPGHNIALYFRDAAGFFVEYSVEEEIVLDDQHYVPRIWSTSDELALDEWRTGPPPPDAFMKQ
jgi:catechol 2,3-dioxygenase-like lactoylglutathione lyase family enzyme